MIKVAYYHHYRADHDQSYKDQRTNSNTVGNTSITRTTPGPVSSEGNHSASFRLQGAHVTKIPWKRDLKRYLHATPGNPHTSAMLAPGLSTVKPICHDHIFTDQIQAIQR